MRRAGRFCRALRELLSAMLRILTFLSVMACVMWPRCQRLLSAFARMRPLSVMSSGSRAKALAESCTPSPCPFRKAPPRRRIAIPLGKFAPMDGNGLHTSPARCGTGPVKGRCQLVNTYSFAVLIICLFFGRVKILHVFLIVCKEILYNTTIGAALSCQIAHRFRGIRLKNE